MTKDRITTILKAWHDAMLECDARMDELAALTGQVVESPLGEAVYHVMGCYTKSVADQLDGAKTRCPRGGLSIGLAIDR